MPPVLRQLLNEAKEENKPSVEREGKGPPRRPRPNSGGEFSGNGNVYARFRNCSVRMCTT